MKNYVTQTQPRVDKMSHDNFFFNTKWRMSKVRSDKKPEKKMPSTQNETAQTATKIKCNMTKRN